VLSRLAEESFWAKVLSLGVFDVLMTPFEPEEVLRVAFSSWSPLGVRLCCELR
jgi:hypothetical protein